MGSTSIAALMAVWIPALMSPGPDIVQIIRVGIRSTRSAVFTALGIVAAIGVWLGASLLGLSALVRTYPGLLSALELLGGGYLLWMGTNAIRGGVASWKARAELRTQARSEQTSPSDSTPTLSMNSWQAFRLGVVTNLANPKAVLFFGAVLSQFITPDLTGLATVGIAALMLAVALVWFIGFALGVRAMARWLDRFSSFIDILAGVIFNALAIYMIVQAISSLLS